MTNVIIGPPEDQVKRKVAKIVPSTKFSKKTWKNDIALVKLDVS
jgi:hypothetical protein